MHLNVGGIDLTTVRGSKFPGDVKLLHRTSGGIQVATPFALAYVLVDMFSENEEARADHEETWRWHGDTYFADGLKLAIAEGWEPAARLLRSQRERRGAA